LKPKKNILIFIDWYKPGYKAGGPIQSCANLVNHLSSFFNFSIVTRNTDFGETKPYTTVISDQWITTEKGIRIYYISKEKLNRTTLKKLLKEQYDILYLNSLFSTYFTLMPLWYQKASEKVIVAPRGMLGAGALAIKPFKKKLFLVLAGVLKLYSKVTWHASTLLEVNEIKNVFGKNIKVVNALNLPPLKKLIYVSREKKVNTLKLFFLSRISVKKNLIVIFQYLKNCKPELTIQFDIIGPIEDENYWNECLKEIDLINTSNPNMSINYIGAVENDNLNKLLSTYHCMILPTFNENFGHVILDSFAAGCPVIISDQTPWKNMEAREIGWDIPLSNPEKFTNAIEAISTMNQEQFNQLSLNAFNEASAFYNDKGLINQNIKMFDNNAKYN